MVLAKLLDPKAGTWVDSDAAELVASLAPVIESGYASELSNQVRNAVATVVQPTVASCALDWWIRVTTGEVANSHCYQVPDAISGEFRAAFEYARDIHADVPPARWIESRREFDRLREGIQPGAEGPLDLDWHGKSKLPDERAFWAEFLELASPSIESLREGKPGPEFEVDEAVVKKLLERTGIDANSRRWKEMERRAQLVADHLYDMRERAQVVASGPVGTELLLAPEIPDVLLTALPDLANELFRPILVDPVDEPGTVSVAETLNQNLSKLDVPARSQWARLLLPWLDQLDPPNPWEPIQIPSIQPQLDDLTRIRAGIAELENVGIDTDEVELALLDGDLPEADRLLVALTQEQESALVTGRLRKELAGLRSRYSREGFEADELDSLDTAIDESATSGSEDAVREKIRLASESFERKLGDRRQTHLAASAGSLRTLQARQETIFDLDRELATGQAPSSSRLAEVEANVEELRQNRKQEHAELLAGIQRELNHPDALPQDAIAEGTAKLAAIADLGQATDQNLMQALELLRQLNGDLTRLRLRRWGSNPADTEPELVKHIAAYCRDRIDYADDDIRRLYVALQTKPFVVLAGLTGSGKSSIVRLFAESIGSSPALGHFRRIAVRPDWIDQSEVLGYINPVSQRFEPGWMADVVRACHAQTDRLFFVLLDEMNLAPVEQYLAEYLSALEESRAGFGDVTIPLYARGAQPLNADEWPAELIFPKNLIVVGTVNIDESTRPLSDRVIDRANVLQLRMRWSRRHHEETRTKSTVPVLVDRRIWSDYVDEMPVGDFHDLLVDLASDLHSVGVGVGLRAHIELERFVANATDVMDYDLAFDYGVLQRIIPKVRGFKRELAPGLESARSRLVEAKCAHSVAVLDRWLDPQVSDDTFLDGTAPIITTEHAS